MGQLHQRYYAFDNFIMGVGSPSAHTSAADPAMVNAGMAHMYTKPNVSSAVQDFHKSIKKSVTDYARLSDDCQFPAWHCSFIVTATAHDMAEILDTKYVPLTIDESQLFKAKSAFMYNVLATVLATSKSRKLVRKYADTLDATHKLCMPTW